jgi:hypothetical protein
MFPECFRIPQAASGHPELSAGPPVVLRGRVMFGNPRNHSQSLRGRTRCVYTNNNQDPPNTCRMRLYTFTPHASARIDPTACAHNFYFSKQVCDVYLERAHSHSRIIYVCPHLSPSPGADLDPKQNGAKVKVLKQNTFFAVDQIAVDLLRKVSSKYLFFSWRLKMCFKKAKKHIGIQSKFLLPLFEKGLTRQIWGFLALKALKTHRWKEIF